MGAVSTRPITIEEFDKLDLPKDRDWELQNGEIIEVSFASWIHNELQHRVRDLLIQVFPLAIVMIELGFQIESTNDKRRADVGTTSKERRQRAATDRILYGAPELVVEVLSPSNTVLELKQYQRLCFQHGTRIFLTLDPVDNTVEVHLEGGKAGSVLRVGDTLQLSLFGTEAAIPVAAIFTGITLPETAEQSE